jgi:predicted phage-related endonuclease
MKVIPKSKHGSQDWLLSRWRDEEGKCVFGASDIPALMGASPYKSRGGLFADKINRPVEQPSNAVFDRGNDLEPALIARASKELGANIFTPDVVYRDGRLSISLDGVDNEKQPSIVVEAKTTTRYSVYDSSDLPTEWLWQGWAQQAVLQVPVWFVVLDRDLRISCVELPNNPEAVDTLRTEAEIFGEWVDNGFAPEGDLLDDFSADDIARIYQSTPSSIELPESAVDWLAQLEEARVMSKQASDLEATAKDVIARLLLDNEIGTINGKQVVSWKSQQGRSSLDTVALKAAHPALVEGFTKQGASFRVMRITKGKAK